MPAASRKKLAWTLGSIAAFLSCVVTIHQKSDYILGEMVYPAFEKHVAATMMANCDTMINIIRIKSASGTRSEIASFTGVPKNQVTRKLGDAILLIDSFIVERAAFKNYLAGISLKIWNEMRDTVIRGYPLRYDDDVFYTQFKGYIFEANYVRSAKKFYFDDAYGTRRECEK